MAQFWTLVLSVGIYNPCHKALLAKVNNRLTGKATSATSGEQIIARSKLLLDLDPDREAHITGIPTNKTEHQAALDLAKVIRDTLSTGGRKYVPSGIAGFDSEEEKEVA